jgi:hypothetical protein
MALSGSWVTPGPIQSTVSLITSAGNVDRWYECSQTPRRIYLSLECGPVDNRLTRVYYSEPNYVARTTSNRPCNISGKYKADYIYIIVSLQLNDPQTELNPTHMFISTLSIVNIQVAITNRRWLHYNEYIDTGTNKSSFETLLRDRYCSLNYVWRNFLGIVRFLVACDNK